MFYLTLVTIFGICFYHHERMCCVYSRPRFNHDLWLQSQILFLSSIRVRPMTSLCFNIGILHLSHGSITMRACVAFIHDPNMSCPSFMILICLVLWPQGLNYTVYNMILCSLFLSDKIVFALGHRHTKVWHMGVLSLDNMLCTFLPFWHWHLTYRWVTGNILSEFYSQFLSWFIFILKLKTHF